MPKQPKSSHENKANPAPIVPPAAQPSAQADDKPAAQPPPRSREQLAERTRVVCQRIAALTPGATAFGSVPAAKVRIDDALARVFAARAHVVQARSVLESLRREIVTGSNPPQTGAHSILGEDLEAYDDLIEGIEGFFAHLGAA